MQCFIPWLHSYLLSALGCLHLPLIQLQRDYFWHSKLLSSFPTAATEIRIKTKLFFCLPPKCGSGEKSQFLVCANSTLQLSHWCWGWSPLMCSSPLKKTSQTWELELHFEREGTINHGLCSSKAWRHEPLRIEGAAWHFWWRGPTSTGIILYHIRMVLDLTL